MPSENKKLQQIEELIQGLDDDVSLGVRRILYPAEICDTCGQVSDMIGSAPCKCWLPVTQDDLDKAGLATRSEMVLTTIKITRTLTDDEDQEQADLIGLDVDGDSAAVVLLGMLRMAEDTILHPNDGDNS